MHVCTHLNWSRISHVVSWPTHEPSSVLVHIHSETHTAYRGVCHEPSPCPSRTLCAHKGGHARARPLLDVMSSTRRNLNNGCNQTSTLIRHITPKCSRLTRCWNAARTSSIVFKNNSILPWCILHFITTAIIQKSQWHQWPCAFVCCSGKTREASVALRRSLWGCCFLGCERMTLIPFIPLHITKWDSTNFPTAHRLTGALIRL